MMKIILLHGPGKISAREKVLQIKSQFSPLEIKEVSGKDMSPEILKMECLSINLFSEKRLLIVENYDQQVDLESLHQEDGNLTLLLIFGNLRADALILKSANKLNAASYFFPEEKETSVFPFLDLLVSQDAKAFIEFEKLYGEYGGQYLLTMIFYQLRKLVAPPKKASPYILKKIANQKLKFPPQKISLLYKKALEIDFKFKTGLIDEKIGLTSLIQKFLFI